MAPTSRLQRSPTVGVLQHDPVEPAPARQPRPGPRRPRRHPARPRRTATPSGSTTIGGVVIHDPLDAAGAAARTRWCSASASTSPTRSSRCSRELGRAAAPPAWSLRAPVPLDRPRSAPRPTQSGVALLGLSRGAPWAHLAAMLRSLLAEGDVGVAEPESLGGLPVRRPVRGRQRDRRRCSTRRSPSRTAAPACSPSPAARTRPTRPASRRSSAARCPSATPGSSTSAASSASCYRSDQPVFVEPGTPRRTTSRCRASRSPSAPATRCSARSGPRCRSRSAQERTEALRDAAKLVALHLLRVRAGADVQRRLRADLLSTALEGGAGAREALDRLGLAGQPLLVLGVAVLDDRDERLDGDRRRRGARTAAAQRRVRDAPERGAPAVGGRARRRRRLRPRARSPAPAPTARSAPYAIAHDFLDRVGDRMPRGGRRSARSRPTSPGWPHARAARRPRAAGAARGPAASAGSPASTTSRSRR